MTNREALHRNKEAVASCFKEALEAQLAIWNAMRDMENIIGGDVDDKQDDLQNMAINCGRPGEVQTVKTDSIISVVEGWLCDPDEESETE